MHTLDEPHAPSRNKRDRPKTHRLFFGLAPPKNVRPQLAKLQHMALGRVEGKPETAIKGRPVAPANLHITLVFLGQVGNERLQAIKRAADGVDGASFDLTLDRLGYWPRPRVLWAGSNETPPSLVKLVADLNIALQECGHHPDPRGYQAHLTLARKVLRPITLPSVTPVSWPVEAFHLFESTSEAHGVRYEVIQTWKLRGQPASHHLPTADGEG